MLYGLVLQYLIKNFYTHTKCEKYSCMSDTPPHLCINNLNVIAITWNHKTLLMPGLIEYFEWAISLHKYDSDHKQVLACWNVTNVKMWKCENVKMWKCENVKMWQMIINGYEFWKSFRVATYVSGGARWCSVQSPPTRCAVVVAVKKSWQSM